MCKCKQTANSRERQLTFTASESKTMSVLDPASSKHAASVNRNNANVCTSLKLCKAFGEIENIK